MLIIIPITTNRIDIFNREIPSVLVKMSNKSKSKTILMMRLPKANRPCFPPISNMAPMKILVKKKSQPSFFLLLAAIHLHAFGLDTFVSLLYLLFLFDFFDKEPINKSILLFDPCSSVFL